MSFFENLFEMAKKGYDFASEKAEKYQEDFEEESIKAESLSDEKLMDRAMHGTTFAQKQAAYRELKNRGYGNS